MDELAILLATYNSDKYLTELLDSLFNQTYTNWTLYIRDDGSIDNTLDILAQYRRMHSNIIILQDQKNLIGPKDSFMFMLMTVNADYYMFCDHDDVWLPTKVEKTFLKMKKIEHSNIEKPIIVHTDMQIVDEHLNLISKSFFAYSGTKTNYIMSSYNHLCHCNCITGCTMMINKEAKEVSFPIPKEALMHDAWIGLRVASCNGIIKCIYEGLVLYRQHGKNTLGAFSRKSFNERISMKNISISFKENIKKFNMAHKANNITILKFIYYKFIFMFK